MSERIDWARRLQAIAQNGLHYASNPFDVERFEAVRAVAAEIAAAASGDDLELVAGLFAAQSGHASPKVDVRGAAFRDGQILLVRNRDDGLWSPPGGWAEVGESPRKAVEKEVREETGYEARASGIVGLYEQDKRDRPRYPFYGWQLWIACELVSSAPGARDEREVLDVSFFAEDALPELSGRATPSRMARAFAYLRDPGLLASFD